MDLDARLDAYDFALPEGAIAQEPSAERRASRLFVLSRAGDGAVDTTFDRIGEWLRAGDLLVLNDTKVIAARITLRRLSGGRVRGLLLEAPRPGRCLALLEGRGRLAAGDRLVTPDGSSLTLAADLSGGRWELELSVAAARDLAAVGRMPLPPYIARGTDSDPRDESDRDRYQTVFATHEGAVAAPTAGLHFDEALLGSLSARGVGIARVTLHVGLGTFLPVRTDDLSAHRMHAETFSIGRDAVESIRATCARNGRVIAVGTTSVRTLETWASRGRPDELAGETDLFIRPGFEFQVVDAMITNFHLPKSTLLVLVSAFAGRERVLRAYAEAVRLGYRFFSYGDAMLIS